MALQEGEPEPRNPDTPHTPRKAKGQVSAKWGRGSTETDLLKAAGEKQLESPFLEMWPERPTPPSHGKQPKMLARILFESS